MREAVFLSFAIGFLAASPFGPMGLLCIRRVFFQGFISGILSALGISCAYSFWAYVAIHGLAFFSYWIEREHRLLEIAIGIFFFLYGLHAIINSPKTDYPTLRRSGRLAEFSSTFFVVFLNPSTFIMFSVLYSLFGVAKGHFSMIDSLELTLSAFIGALTLWIAVFLIIHNIKRRIDDCVFRRISRISAFGITTFGIIILLYAI